MFTIKAINDKNILINEQVYPTPVVALSYIKDDNTIRLYSRDIFIMALSYTNIEVVDQKGFKTSGATNNREDVVKAINAIGNIKNTLGDDYYTKLELESILKEFSNKDHYHGFHSPVESLSNTGSIDDIYAGRYLFRTFSANGAIYNNVIIYLRSSINNNELNKIIQSGGSYFEINNQLYVIESLQEGDLVYIKDIDEDYILRDNDLVSYHIALSNEHDPVRFDPNGRLLSQHPTESTYTNKDNQVVTLKYLLDLVNSYSLKDSRFTGDEYLILGSGKSNIKPVRAKIQDILDNLVQRPLQIRDTIRNPDSIPDPSTLKNGDLYLVKLDRDYNTEDNNEGIPSTDPTQWSLTITDPEFTFKNLDLVAWTGSDGVNGHWIDIGQIDTVVNLYTEYTNRVINIYCSASDDDKNPIVLTLANHSTDKAGLLSPEYSSDIEESSHLANSTNEYYPDRHTLVRRNADGHYETKNHTHSTNDHLSPSFSNNEVLNWNDINHLINRDPIRLRDLQNVTHINDLEAGFYDAKYIHEIVNAQEFTHLNNVKTDVSGHEGVVIITTDYKNPEKRYSYFIDTTDSCMYEIIDGELTYINDRRASDLIPNIRHTVLKNFNNKDSASLNEWYSDDNGNLYLVVQSTSTRRHILQFKHDKLNYDNDESNKFCNIYKILTKTNKPDTTIFTENTIQIVNNPKNPTETTDLNTYFNFRGTPISPGILTTLFNGHGYETNYVIRTDKYVEYRFQWIKNRWVLINNSDNSYLGTVEDFKSGVLVHFNPEYIVDELTKTEQDRIDHSQDYSYTK